MVRRAGLLSRTYLGLLAAMLALASCTGPHIAVDQPLPDRDIVYQVEHDAAPGYGRRVGFVNADGTGQEFRTITTTRISAIAEPVWTTSGDHVLFGNQYTDQLSSIAQDGTLREYRCPLLRLAPTVDPDRVIVAMAFEPTRLKIALYDLENDSVLRTFAVEEGDHLSIGANALADTLLVYRRRWDQDVSSGYSSNELVVYDISSGEGDVLVSRHGLGYDTPLEYPSISPDGQWIAYTASDGLYLVRPDGSDQLRVMPMELIRNSPAGPGWDQWPPAVSWSPDSQSLVYHRCTVPAPTSCGGSPENYSIYKLNINTLEEVLLVEGGLNPYWRLAPSEVEQ